MLVHEGEINNIYFGVHILIPTAKFFNLILWLKSVMNVLFNVLHVLIYYIHFCTF